MTTETTFTITIIPTTNGPAGKLADAELHYTGGLLDGLKLIGFGIWETRGRRCVTFPARQYSVNGERRSFALLRPTGDVAQADALKTAILAAYDAWDMTQSRNTGAITPSAVAAKDWGF